MSQQINSFKHLITSVSGSLEDPESLARDTVFNVIEIEVIYDFLKKINNVVTNDGIFSINKKEFRQALFQTTTNEYYFVDRIFDLFDRKYNGILGFEEFIRAISTFHPNASIDDKIEFSFQLYDLNQKGFIERREVQYMVMVALMELDIYLSRDPIIKTIIHSKFEEVDANQEGTMNKKEWRSLVMRNPILLEQITINYLKDIMNPIDAPTSVDLGLIEPC